jgi:hypothetical protein
MLYRAFKTNHAYSAVIAVEVEFRVCPHSANQFADVAIVLPKYFAAVVELDRKGLFGVAVAALHDRGRESRELVFFSVVVAHPAAKELETHFAPHSAPVYVVLVPD